MVYRAVMRNLQFSHYSFKAIHRERRLPVYGLNQRHESQLSSRAEIVAAGGARDRLLQVGRNIRAACPRPLIFPVSCYTHENDRR
jgi:hypothetical protein